MKLSDWQIEVISQPSGEQTLADVSCAEGRKVARVRVCDGFDDLSEDEKRHTICHELIHPHLHMLVSGFTDLSQHLSRDVFQAFVSRLLNAIEYGVDGLADAFAHSLPTIEEHLSEPTIDEYFHGKNRRKRKAPKKRLSQPRKVATECPPTPKRR
jgi:hypothetical protein